MDAYVDELARHSTHSYGFAQWDIKGDEDALEAAERLGCDRLDLGGRRRTCRRSGAAGSGGR